MAVGVGSVQGEVFVGGLRNQCPLLLQVCLLFAIVIVALEKSDHYVEAAAVALVVALVQQYVIILPGLGRIRLVERWAAGREVDRGSALDATYSWARGAVVRAVATSAVGLGLLGVVVGVIAGATESRLGAVRDSGRHRRSRHPAGSCAQLR